MIVRDLLDGATEHGTPELAAFYVFLISKGYVKVNDSVDVLYNVQLNDVEEKEFMQFKEVYLKNFKDARLYTSKYDKNRFHLVYAHTQESAYQCIHDLFGKAPMAQKDITDRRFKSFIDQHGNDVHIYNIDIISYPYYVGLFDKRTGNIRVPQVHKMLY